MIYTSYFAKLKSLPDDVIPISICAKAPDWYKGKQYKKLAPKYDFFMKWKENHDNDYYIKCFNEQVLNQLNVEDVIHDLVGYLDVNKDIDIALLCYEKPEDFCHRHLVADWLNENGYKCEEYVYINKKVENLIDNRVNEIMGNSFTKVEHNSLCETETYEGKGRCKNDIV